MEVLYHKNCLDGFGAAWAFYTKFAPGQSEYFTYHAMDYDSPMPLMPSSNSLTSLRGQPIIVMLDYSRKAPDLMNLLEKGASIWIIDHHKTAVEEVDKVLQAFPNRANFRATLDMNRSGAVLTWNMVTNEAVPQMLLHIQDTDLWQFKLEKTRPIISCLSTIPRNFDAWTKFSEELNTERGYKEIVQKGQAIVDYQQHECEQACQMVEFIQIDEYTVPSVVMNVNAMLSKTAHLLLNLHHEAPFSTCRQVLPGNRIRYSLRGRGDFDTTEVAKRFGGGGHRDASGFTIPGSLENILKSS